MKKKEKLKQFIEDIMNDIEKTPGEEEKKNKP